MLSLVGAAVWAAWFLELSVAELLPSEGGAAVFAGFVARALAPALAYEADFVPPGAPPLLAAALLAAGRTALVAAAAMGLALGLGVVLGSVASSSWWAKDPAGERSLAAKLGRRCVAPALFTAARVLIALLRSVHEILWAVLLLAAVGFNELAAVVAIALPYGGTLAKVFSELLDEAPRDAAAALRGLGASRLAVVAFGVLPRALPDMLGYALYRFECALRSSAALGFFGFETLGLYLRQSFRSGHYGEVWTYLYVLIATVAVVDAWSGAVRRRLAEPRAVGRAPPHASVDQLRRGRPRDHWVRGSLWAFAAILLAPWVCGVFDFADAFTDRRAANLQRFLQQLWPFPLQGVPWDSAVAWTWVTTLWHERGAHAAGATLALSLLAVQLAAVLAVLACLPAARTLWATEPYVAGGRPPGDARRWLWWAGWALARATLLVARAVPEYVLAFFLLAVLGPSAWAVVLALALHNAGVLGRLYAEVLENAEATGARALRQLGAGRRQLAAVALGPAVLPRLMLFFFYRWETCVREATVLGMLGVVSLGYWVQDARARGEHDVTLFFVAVGAAIILVGDLLSGWARQAVRAS
ncbi:MAG: ABC transporter permease subunit [Planctomycetota bacterium]